MPKEQLKNKMLMAFRLKVRAAITNYTSEVKAMIYEDKQIGISNKAIKEASLDPEGTISMEREKFKKNLKKITASLINAIHIQYYLDGL